MKHLTDNDILDLNILENRDQFFKKCFDKRKGDRRKAINSCVEPSKERRKKDRRTV